MSSRADRLRSRIEALTPDQRRRLAGELKAGGGRELLVAHVQTADRTVTEADLMEWLGDRLPGHMIPQQIRILDDLPRTRAGKVDRRALADAVPDRSPVRLDAGGDAEGDAGDGGEEAFSETERLLAEIWKEVLDTDLIRRHDDFFELGGDSILSIRVISRARKAGLVIDSPDFFATPTIAHLASVARATPES